MVKMLVEVHRYEKLEEIALNVLASVMSYNTTQALRSLEKAAIIVRDLEGCENGV